MINSLHPKDIFAASLMELLSKMPLTKINVKDIVENCDLSRQTFYRYFKDKYDLINWCLKREMDQLNEELEKDPTAYLQITIRLLNMIKSQKNFYISAFKMSGQNAMVDFFINYSARFGIEYFYPQVHDEKSWEKLAFAFRYTAYGSVYSIINWALTGMKESPENLANLMADAMPPEVRQMYDRYGQ